MDVARGGEHLLGARAYADVLGEILPTNNAGAVEKELRGTGNVVAVGTRGGMKQIVTADHVEIGIGQKREAEAGFAAQARGDIRRINADGDWANTECLEFVEPFLDAS